MDTHDSFDPSPFFPPQTLFLNAWSHLQGDSISCITLHSLLRLSLNIGGLLSCALAAFVSLLRWCPILPRWTDLRIHDPVTMCRVSCRYCTSLAPRVVDLSRRSFVFPYLAWVCASTLPDTDRPYFQSGIRDSPREVALGNKRQDG